MLSSLSSRTWTEHDEALDALFLDHAQHLVARLLGRPDVQYLVRRGKPAALVAQGEADAAGSQIDGERTHGAAARHM